MYIHIHDPIRAGTVRILTNNGGTAGTGFIIFNASSYVLIATCTHVAQLANPQIFAEPTVESISIAFDIAFSEKVWEATIYKWLPVEKEDTTILKIDAKPPNTVRALHLSSATLPEGRKVSVFGYPYAGEITGSWGYSDGCRPGSRKGEQLLLQLQSKAITLGFSGAPVWDNARNKVIGMITQIDLQDSYGRQGENAYAIPVEVLREMVNDLEVLIPSPFHGSAPFTEEEAKVFVVDGETINAMTHRLNHHEDNKKLVTILGPFACGKTSLVQAYLIAQLKNGVVKGHENWDILLTHLSHDPFKQLEEQGLIGASKNLIDSVNDRCQHNGHACLVIIIDQFEEVLLTCPDKIQDIFIENLLAIINSSIAMIILVLQDAFYHLLARHKKLIRLVEESLVNVVSPYKKEDLINVAQKRAHAFGVTIDPALIEKLISQVTNVLAQDKSQHSSFIALYELLLTQIWQQREDQTVIDETVINLDKVQVGLNDWADTLFLTFDEEKQQLLKDICLKLVALGDQRQSIPDTQLTTPLSALCNNEDEQYLIYKLVDQGFFVISRDIHIIDGEQIPQEMIGFAQKALLYDWNRLQNWLSETRQFLEWHQSVEKRVNAWYENGINQDIHILLQGYELREAEFWLAKQSQDFPQSLQSFVHASFHQEQQQQSKAENAQHQQLARVQHLAMQAKTLRDQQTDKLQLSVLLAIETMQRTPCIEAYQNLYAGLALLPRLEIMLSHYAPVSNAIFSRDGCYIASGGKDGRLWIKGISASNQVLHLFHVGYPVDIVAFSAGSSYVAVAGKGVTLYETKSGKIFLPLPDEAFVKTIVFSPGKPSCLAIAKDNRTIDIWHMVQDDLTFDQWDIAKDTPGQLHALQILPPEQLYTLQLSQNVVKMTFSPDGYLLVTIGENGTVDIWEAESGRYRGNITHPGNINSLIFSPDGKGIAIINDTTTIPVWKLEQEQKQIWYKTEPALLLKHKQHVQNVTFSPDGLHIATVSGHTTIVWNMISGNEVVTLFHNAQINTIAFSHDGRYIVTGSADCTARMWIVLSGLEFLRVVHEHAVNCASFNLSGRYLLTGSESGVVKLWTTTPGSQIAHISHTGGVRYVAFFHTEAGQYHLATAGVDNFVQISHITKSGFQFGANLSHPQQISTIALSPSGYYLASACDNHFIYIWSLERGHCIAAFQHNGSVYALAFSQDEQYLASASADGTARVWEIQRRNLLVSLPHQYAVYTVAFNSNGQYLTTGDAGGMVYVWDWQYAENTPIASTQHSSFVHTAAFIHDENIIVTASNDGTARLWEWTSESSQFILLEQYQSIQAIALSHDAQFMATASSDGIVKIWETIHGYARAHLSLTNAIHSICFSPDGCYLAIAGNDHTASVWEWESGQKIIQIPHTNTVHMLAFSSDGKYLATASGDGTAGVWLWQPDDLIAEAGKRLSRNFSQEEWEHYFGEEPYHKTYMDFQWREIREILE